VRRFVRLAIRMLLMSAVLTALIRVGRAILVRSAPEAGHGAIRTGSFDHWPAVPVAPGRRPPAA
jgi:hypothetical protein